MSDVNVTDAALDAVVSEPTDLVSVKASDLVKLRQQAGQFAEVERSTAGYVVGNELSQALAAVGDRLMPGSAPKLAKLIKDDLKAKRTDAGWAVQTADGKTPAEVVAAFLADPDNAMFLRANGRGGSGAGDAGQRAAATTVIDPARPKTLGEAMMAQMAGRPSGSYMDKYRT